MFDPQAQANADDVAGADSPRHVAPDSKRAHDADTGLQGLADMDSATLRAQWRRLYRSNPPACIRRDLLALAVAWKRQEKARGGSSGATRRRLANLAKTLEEDGDLARSRAVRLKPGARLLREWRGETHMVLVTEAGFEWRGQRYGSLSVIARTITGTRWSGPRFFGLKNKPAATGKQEKADG